MVSEIISGVAGGLIVYAIQYLVELRRRMNETREKEKAAFEAGRKGASFIQFADPAIIETFLPGKVTIEKVIAELGQPDSTYDDFLPSEKVSMSSDIKVHVYKYQFCNAVLLFSTYIGKSELVSLTVANNNKENTIGHLVQCFFSPESETDGGFVGLATVEQTIIAGSYNCWNELFKDWGYSAIQARYNYRYIKHLNVTYFIYDIVKTKEEFRGKRIEQVCVSTVSNVHPFVYYYDVN